MINTEHFILLAGNPEKWDAEAVERAGNGEELVRIQEDQHSRGRRSARLKPRNMGWCIETASSIDPSPFIEYEGERAEFFATRTEAVVVGKAWAEEDPDNREFYAYKGYFEEYEEDGTRTEDDHD